MNKPWSFPLTPQPPDFRIDWDGIMVEHPWLKGLDECPQNPVHHAEGDVLIHTRMVAERLTEDASWRVLEPTLRSILFASALLHDIGKPATTQVQNGRITSPG